MKIWCLIGLVFFAAIPLSSCAARFIIRDILTPEKPLETVSGLDPKRYAGHWYSIASFPTWFEKGCRCTSAEYRIKENHRLEVVNRCRRKGGLSEALGQAWPIEGGEYSRLYVSFRQPFKGKYYVIDLAEDYSWALVGHPNRNYLWILSRTPNLSSEIVDDLKEAAVQKGFDITKLKHVHQDCSD